MKCTIIQRKRLVPAHRDFLTQLCTVGGETAVYGVYADEAEAARAFQELETIVGHDTVYGPGPRPWVRVTEFALRVNGVTTDTSPMPDLSHLHF